MTQTESNTLAAMAYEIVADKAHETALEAMKERRKVGRATEYGRFLLAKAQVHHQIAVSLYRKASDLCPL